MPKLKQVNPEILKYGEESFVKHFPRRFGKDCKLDPKAVYKDLVSQVAKCKDKVKTCSVEV